MSAQLDALKKALTSEDSDLVEWKVLIYDERARSALNAAVLREPSLYRDAGITLRMLLNSKRESLPDVPAFYLVRPSVENLKRIASDLKENLYGRFFLHFTRPIASENLRKFAESVSEFSGRVVSVKDDFLDFVSLEPRLFTLNRPRALYDYARPGLNENVVMNTLNDVAESLVCFLMCGSDRLPIMRAPTGGAAEFVAKAATKMLHDLPEDYFTDLNSSSFASRKIVVVLDRNFDLSTPVSHSMSYRALLEDVFGFNDSNFIKLDDKFHPMVDDFFEKFADSDFKKAVESHTNEMSKVTSQIDSLKTSEDTSSLADAVKKLPTLTAKKNALNVHVNLMSKAFGEIKSRELAKLHDLESSSDVSKLAEFLASSSESLDKTRAAIVGACKDAKRFKCDHPAVQYVLQSGNPAPAAEKSSSFSSHLSARLSRIVNASSIKTPALAVVDKLSQSEMLYFDPKHGRDPLSAASNFRSADSHNTEEVVLFVVGGGCSQEVADAMRYTKTKVTYGATALLSPEAFVEAYAELRQ